VITMIDALTSRIRGAVASGEYQRALLLWNEYSARLQEELRVGSLTSGRLAEMRELMEWSRRVMLCARAHAQDQLNSLHVAAEYGVAPAPQAPRIIQARF